MDRKKFLKISSLAGIGAIANPVSLYAQESWVIEILEELFKVIIIDVFEKPIETLLRTVLNIPSPETEKVKEKNEDYAKQGLIENDVAYATKPGSPQTVYYPLRTQSDVDRSGKYIVPFYNYNGDKRLSHIADFDKHEAESLAKVATNLHFERSVQKGKNTNIMLPSSLVGRGTINGGIATQFYNREGGLITLKRYTDYYASCVIKSPSLSDKEITVSRFALKT
jgi:hypothetical protein